MKKKKKKKVSKEIEDFVIPLAIPDEIMIDPNKYLHKKKGFTPQDIEGEHKTENIKTQDGLNFNADVN